MQLIEASKVAYNTPDLDLPISAVVFDFGFQTLRCGFQMKQPPSCKGVKWAMEGCQKVSLVQIGLDMSVDILLPWFLAGGSCLRLRTRASGKARYAVSYL